MNNARPQNHVVRIMDESSVSGDVDLEIRELLCRCFPADVEYFSRSRGWHGSYPAFSVIIHYDSRLVGHLSVVMRTVSVGSHDVRVGGVQNVCVAPGSRGAGLLAPIMVAAMREAGLRNAEFGLLFCLPALQHAYQRCGWSRVSDRQIHADMDGKAVDRDGKNIAMFISLVGKAFPDGDIALNGMDW
jgi:predicted acetyltransferase